MISFNHLGIVGRLGNQMFQYATLKSIADNHGYEFTIPESNFKDKWSDHQLFNAFKMTNLKNRGRVNDRYLKERQFNFDQDIFDNCPDNVSLYGYFQTERYFSNISESIKEDFTFYDEVLENCEEVMDGMKDSISLHVRRTDYVEKSEDHPPCSIDYYKEALNYFDENRQVIIFTDDIEWCKKQEIFSSDRFMISETENNVYDLCLMTMCKDYIIANSSFSWWGAWLSKNSNPQVISPKKWFGTTGYTSNNNTEDIVPDRWIKI